MNEEDVEKLLQEAIDCLESIDTNFTGPYVNTIRTFEEARIVSENRGLVIPFEDGSEFYVTIVKSK